MTLTPPPPPSTPPIPSTPPTGDGRPTLIAVVSAAVEATGATRGWLLRADDERGDFVVTAAVDGDGSTVLDLLGTRRDRRGVAGFVLASGQPAAVKPGRDDRDDDGAGGADGVPAALLVAPCHADEVMGVIELVDPPSGSFSFDDVETVTLLSEIAGAALGETAPVSAPPSPAELGRRLATLAADDPTRYAEIARVVEALT